MRPFLAVLALPVTVTLLVPALLLRAWPAPALPSTLWGWALRGAGLLLIATGLILVVWTVSLFARVGQGTLAPWDPPRRLVVRGPYRHVRNPMITGVAAILLGEASLFGALPLLVWFGLFSLANGLYIPLLEEPGLTRRFGADYADYCRHVPRWLPRLSAWVSSGSPMPPASPPSSPNP